MASVVFFLLWSKAFPFYLMLLNFDCLDMLIWYMTLAILIKKKKKELIRFNLNDITIELTHDMIKIYNNFKKIN